MKTDFDQTNDSSDMDFDEWVYLQHLLELLAVVYCLKPVRDIHAEEITTTNTSYL